MGLRIIGGSLKNRRLTVPRGKTVRPTSDRLRESIFAILGSTVKDRHVLDLFAGSGALGIESISRGAESCVFVDRQSIAISAIAANIGICNLHGRTRIFKRDIMRSMNGLKSYETPFDLIFMDPPYEKNLVVPSLVNLCRSEMIQDSASIVIEHSINEPLPDRITVDGQKSPLKMEDQRKYGKTLVSFFVYML